VVVAKLPPEVRQAEGFDPTQSAGLFVGIRHFTKDESFLEVPFAVDDAVDLADLFVRELELVRADKVVLSLSGEPQKPASRERLTTLLGLGVKRESAELTDVLLLLDRQRKASGPSGVFVAAFATHGFSDQGSDYLVAADSLRPFIRNTGVVLNQVFDVVARASAPRRLVLLDACRERFTSARATGGSPMSASFADAIAGARGLAVISGATLGGYAYDDLSRQNGVFSAAVLDGLRGGAPTDARSFITVRTLGDYVNERVLTWVRDNRSADVLVSQGVSRRIEGVVAEMPLAVDAGRLETVAAYQRRRDAALDRLRRNLETPLSGAMYDEMKASLGGDSPSADRLALLSEIEALDGSERMRRALAFYWQGRRSASVPSESERRIASEPRRPAEGEREVVRISGVDFAWRFIPPGTFKMGSPAGEEGRDDDETFHDVTLTRGFWMSETEVTQGQWQALMKSNPAYFKRCGLACPIETVNWYEALAFANALSLSAGLDACYELSGNEQAVFTSLDCEGYRLPTEAEWEYAARARSQTAIYTGIMPILGLRNSPKLGEIAWYGGNSGVTYEGGYDCSDWKEREQRAEKCGTHPVGTKPRNDWGLADMLGNVYEWVWDSYGKYPEAVERDPRGSDGGAFRVLRGGGWFGYARDCRAALRLRFDPRSRDGYVGFRLVRTLP
jgi:formylglycine-generating enzyme required for sulfatase activity